MKFLVISDTHGKIELALEVYKARTDIDMIIHLGDNYRDSIRIEEALNVKVIGVKGNMDGAYGNNEHKVLETEFGKILLTHGHLENVKSSLQKLLYKTEELNCKAALFGHTHEAYFNEFSGIYLFNPGSLPLPRGLNKKPSYGIITTNNNEFKASIVYYNNYLTSDSPNTPKRVAGGYLKSLLNNSDRF